MQKDSPLRRSRGYERAAHRLGLRVAQFGGGRDDADRTPVRRPDLERGGGRGDLRLAGVGSLRRERDPDLDYKAVLAVTLVVGLIYSIVNILVDVVHAWLDPRVAESL